MIHPLLHRDIQPSLPQQDITLFVSLPIEFHQSIINAYNVKKTQYMFDSYPCFISFIGSVALFSGKAIPSSHANSLISLLYSSFKYQRIITLTTVESIQTLSYLNNSHYTDPISFKMLQIPFSIDGPNAGLFTHAEVNKIPCVSLLFEQNKEQVDQVVEFLKKSTTLEKISLPVASYSMSTLYA
ncbi:Uncharacterized protein QTN25_010056 [Entamoeba marina]